MKKMIFMLTLLLGIVTQNTVFAHEEHPKKSSQDTTKKMATHEHTATSHDSSALKTTATDVSAVKSHNHTTEGFATLHPMIVHFPIVLLMLAGFLSLINLYFKNNAFDYSLLGLTAVGLSTAYLSGSYFHPHTVDLSASAEAILLEHEQWASYTLYASSLALLFQMANLFFLKNKFVINILICAFLLASGVFVALAGHHGAELTHIEGVGPQGKFIHTAH